MGAHQKPRVIDRTVWKTAALTIIRFDRRRERKLADPCRDLANLLAGDDRNMRRSRGGCIRLEIRAQNYRSELVVDFGQIRSVETLQAARLDHVEDTTLVDVGLRR